MADPGAPKRRSPWLLLVIVAVVAAVWYLINFLAIRGAT